MPAVQTAITHLPLDWVLLAMIAAIITIDAIRSGTQHAAAFSLAAPLALLMYTFLPTTQYLAPYIASFNTNLQASVFVGIFVVLLILIYRMLPVGLQTGTYPLKALAVGVAAAAIFITTVMQVPAITQLFHFSPLMTRVFGPAYRVLWLIGGYILFAFAAR